MSVVSVKLLRTASGEVSHGRDTKQAIYQVRVDDENDGPFTVENAPGLPPRNSFWQYGGETGIAVHTRRTSRRVPRSKVVWEVTCHYEFEVERPEGKDEGGLPALSPADVTTRVTPGFRTLSEVVTRATFLGYFDSNGNALQIGNQGVIGTKRIPGNSAGIAFIPALERSVRIPTVRVQRYYRKWRPEFTAAAGKLNSETFKITHVDGVGVTVYDQTFSPRELLLDTVDVDQRQHASQLWYWMTFEFVIGDHFIETLDQGLVVIGEDNGLEAAVPRRRLEDEVGRPIDEPYPFDGEGKPVADPTDADQLVYLRWQVDDEFDMNNLKLFDDSNADP